MLEFTSLPSSEGKEITESQFFEGELIYTFNQVVDEESLYKELNSRLKKLEVSLETERQEVNEIEEKTSEFKFATEEKEEILLRCDWLEKLCRAEASLGTIKSKEDAAKLRRSIQMVQTSPLKKTLLDRIASIEETLGSKKEEVNPEQKLMNEAIKKDKLLFSNLGVAGREQVLSEAIEKYGDQAEVHHLHSLATELTEQVKDLSAIAKASELKVRLAQLPLPHYSSLSETEQQEIADMLITSNDWSTLVDLQRKVVGFQKAKLLNEKEVAENRFNTSQGEATYTLNIGNDAPQFFKEEKAK